MNKTGILRTITTIFLLDFVVSLSSKGNKLIYILVDGFRYDYLDDQPADSIPGFSKFLQNGVRAEYMTPVFPSMSCPTWTTLVTGLYTESHGIIGSRFYDAENKDTFRYGIASSTGKKKWWTAEPIWTTTTRANKKTAVLLWLRCDIPFDGITPEYCEYFNNNANGNNLLKYNIDKALSKIEEGFEFILILSRDETDSAAYNYGPDSEQRRRAVRRLDSSIKYLLDGIENKGLTDEVNIIIVGDHGMTSIAPEEVNMVELDDYLLTEHVESVSGGGSYSNIKVKDGFLDQVYEKLKVMPGVRVYRHAEIPEYLHYKNSKYIYDIVLVANINTYIRRSRSAFQIPARYLTLHTGYHGFDPREKNMRTIFFATGPDFKNGSHKIPPIESVDVYPLLAHLLQVKPLPNNGTLGRIKMALRSGVTCRDAVEFGLFLPFVISFHLVYIKLVMIIEAGDYFLRHT